MRLIPYARWTAREVRTAVDLCTRHGLATAIIAERLGRTPNAVRSRLLSEGVSRRRAPVTRAPWTDEDDARLRALWLTDGLSEAACGRVLNRTRSAIAGRVHRKGWTRNTQTS